MELSDFCNVIKFGKQNITWQELHAKENRRKEYPCPLTDQPVCFQKIIHKLSLRIMVSSDFVIFGSTD